MRYPTKFNQLTLGQFIELHKLSQVKDIDRLDFNVKKLSILTGKPIEHIEELDRLVYRSILRETESVTAAPKNIPVKKRLLVKGQLLYPTLSLQEMKVNQLTDFYALYKESGGDRIISANKLLAVMFRPWKIGRGITNYHPNNHKKLSDLLLHANAEDCMGYVFFYSRVWKRCEPHIKTSLETSQATINKIMEEIMTDKEFLASLNIGAGNIM